MNKKCDFVDISSTFWNLIHFWPHRFTLNFRKLLILLIFILFFGNWTYVQREIKHKVWFCQFFFKFSTTFWSVFHFRSRKFSQYFYAINIIWMSIIKSRFKPNVINYTGEKLIIHL